MLSPFPPLLPTAFPPSGLPPLKPGRPLTSIILISPIFAIGLTLSLMIDSILSASFKRKALLLLASLLRFSAVFKAFLPAASISYLSFAARVTYLSCSAFDAAEITSTCFIP